MPFGVMNAPSTFQRMMDLIFEGIPFVRVYLDELFIFVFNLDEHIEHLIIIFQLIEKQGLKLKISKCTFAQSEVALLGHIFNNLGVSVDPTKIKAIREARYGN